jgi:hypothetical protein
LPETIRVKTPAVSSVPSTITGFGVSANFETVMFYFNPVNDIDLDSYEYQLYDIPNPTSSTTPIASGKNKANVFTISVTNSTDSTPKTYYGRVAVVNSAGIVGTYTSLVSSGATPLIGNQYISELTAAKISSGTINAAEITLNGSNSVIKSSNYSSTLGWRIDGLGNATFNTATIRSEISSGTTPNWFRVDTSGNMWLGGDTYASAPFKVSNAGALTAISVNITGATLTSPAITGGSMKIGSGENVFKADSSGIYLGSETFSSAEFRVTPGGALTATSANITGAITAISGTFTGTILSGVNNTTQFGNNINGSANYSGIKIGNTGWNNAWIQRSDGTIYFNAQTNSVAPDGSARGVSRVYMDDNNSLISFNNGTFSVDYNGAVYASSGIIAGWTITSNLFQGQSVGNTRIQMLKSVPANTTYYANESYHNLPAMVIFDNINTQAVGYFGSYSDNVVSMEGISGLTWIEIDSAGQDSVTISNDSSSTSSLAGIHISSGGQNVWFDAYTHTSTTNQYLRILQDGRAVLGVPSDISLKQNIATAPSVIDKFKQLNIVNFYWKDKYTYGSAEQIGLIAQELEEIFPSFVGLDHSTNKKNISTDPLLFICIKAIQELCDKIDLLELKLENG